MGHPRRRSLARGLTIAAIVAVGALEAQPATAQTCFPVFNISPSSYNGRLCGMPDYDQRRTSANLRGDGRTLFVGPALAANGSCHCVPTAFTNLLGYYVTKGVKEGLYPRKFNWDGRAGYVARMAPPASI